MYRILSIIIFFFPAIVAEGQINFNFSFCLNNKELVKDSAYAFNNLYDSVVITNLRFYISNIEFIYKDKKINEKNSFHLIDLKNQVSQKILIAQIKPDNLQAIVFNIGIDSTTIVSGNVTGDLDPVKGMFWTWQSGFINIKSEGYFVSRNNQRKDFQCHLGGYRYPYNTINKIKVYAANDSIQQIKINLDDFLAAVVRFDNPEIMSPGADAVNLSSAFAHGINVLDK